MAIVTDIGLQEFANLVAQETNKIPTLIGDIAPAYDPTSGTYAVGALVMNGAQLYQCNTAIASPEAWDATHWDAVPISSLLSSGGGSAPLVSVTHAELLALKNAGTLVAGTQYRITDYVFTSVQTGVTSANHAFDIIVIADSATTLNENARAVLHAGDTYFANSKLEAWEIKYCVTNDTARFAWADATNGKGVIYYMKDEFENEAPCDFKNALITMNVSYTTTYYNGTISCTNNYMFGNDTNDHSLTGLFYHNSIGPRTLLSNDVSVAYIPLIVMGKTGKSLPIFDISIDKDCNYIQVTGGSVITIGKSATMVYIGYADYYGPNHDFVIGDYCQKISIGGQSMELSIGNGSHEIYLSASRYTTLGENCGNIYCDQAWNVSFGNTCYTIKTQQWNSVHCGDTCHDFANTNSVKNSYFGEGCNNLSFTWPCFLYGLFFEGYNSYINIASTYCSDIVIEAGCRYATINTSDTSDGSDSNLLQKIKVELGVMGASSANPTTLTVATRNNTFTTTYRTTGHTEIDV